MSHQRMLLIGSVVIPWEFFKRRQQPWQAYQLVVLRDIIADLVEQLHSCKLYLVVRARSKGWVWEWEHVYESEWTQQLHHLLLQLGHTEVAPRARMILARTYLVGGIILFARIIREFIWELVSAASVISFILFLLLIRNFVVCLSITLNIQQKGSHLFCDHHWHRVVLFKQIITFQIPPLLLSLQTAYDLRLQNFDLVVEQVLDLLNHLFMLVVALFRSVWHRVLEILWAGARVWVLQLWLLLMHKHLRLILFLHSLWACASRWSSLIEIEILFVWICLMREECLVLLQLLLR